MLYQVKDARYKSHTFCHSVYTKCPEETHSYVTDGILTPGCQGLGQQQVMGCVFLLG